jgi:circadian clock protein KaiB
MKARKQAVSRPRKAPARKSPKAPKPLVYSMRLYITGVTPRSSRAIANLQRLCEEHLQGRYKHEVIDVYQQPRLARDSQIIAAPTLIKKFPLPLRRFIGDMSNTRNLLIGLELLSKALRRSPGSAL